MNFQAYDPRTGEALEPLFASATAEQVEQAATAAGRAFRDYSRRPGQERSRLLRAIATRIEEMGDALLERASRETALPLPRLANERARTCFQLRLFADVAEKGDWFDERIDSADPQRQPPKPKVRSLLRPIGPVVVFGAGNFPLAFSVAGGDTAAALAVGCPVIVKAHPAHPGTSALVGEAIKKAVAECGLPGGVFALLFDAGHEVGVALVRHPFIRAGAFTGSARGGLALVRAAQSRAEPIPFFAEMGSVNPVFILPRGLAGQAEAIAEGLQASMTLGCGQFCTQPGLVFLIDNAAGRAFLEQLSARVSATPPSVMLTRAMSETYRRSIEERTAMPGVKLLAEVAHASAGAQVGAALHSTDASTFVSIPALAEEVFGPASLAVLCHSTGDFERCAERLQGQLTATVWAEREELGAHDDLLWQLEQRAGRIVFNGFPTGVEVGAAMVHGGPFPATSDSRFTSVGTRSILRFVRPVAYQEEIS